VTAEFLDTFGQFSKRDQRRFLKALELLDHDEQHRSLRVHQLTGDLSGFWSASASDELRVLFTRGPEGTKILSRCSRHYR
jgi:mRNA-degrading endonuclease YafQ of YafQ-DinJ toxin-antitoxin module